MSDKGHDGFPLHLATPSSQSSRTLQPSVVFDEQDNSSGGAKE